MSILRFTKDHEWVRLDDDGNGTVGITKFAQEQLGDLVFVELPAIGKSFESGEVAAVIKSVKAAGEIKMPLTGSIVAVNDLLKDEPAKVNESPQSDGWFFRVQIAEAGTFEALMDEKAYAKFINA